MEAAAVFLWLSLRLMAFGVPKLIHFRRAWPIGMFIFPIDFSPLT